ncbi:MAG: 3'-5' exonuclease [Prevotella sp.]|nr:3'-5' exonuclease [Prevotella sp.]
MKKDWMIKESEIYKDSEQTAFIMATLDKSCIVTGCAGSGKSVLALHKARRIQNEKGDNYKIIVFTKALCHYMNAGRVELDLHNYFCTYWYWKYRLNCSPADYIIVDEIQDFSKEEIKEFIAATKKNFFFFGDTAQSIYEGLKITIPVDKICSQLQINEPTKKFDLYYNYCLPKPVAKVALQIGLGVDSYDENMYKSIETERPRFIKYNSQQEQLMAIHRIINNKNMNDVAILFQHNGDVIQAYNFLRTLEGNRNYEIKYKDGVDWRNSMDTLNFKSPNPKIMTYHSAKGLRFDAVFIPYAEKFTYKNESDRKALYVAMTRTCKYLYVMYSVNLPPLLTAPQIDTSLYETTEIDEIDDF